MQVTDLQLEKLAEINLFFSNILLSCIFLNQNIGRSEPDCAEDSQSYFPLISKPYGQILKITLSLRLCTTYVSFGEERKERKLANVGDSKDDMNGIVFLYYFCILYCICTKYVFVGHNLKSKYYLTVGDTGLCCTISTTLLYTYQTHIAQTLFHWR